MEKDFQKWHHEKSGIDRLAQRPFFREREIWFCSLGLSIGFEQDGRGKQFLRPVVVTKKFNNEVLWAVPLTKRNDKQGPFYFPFVFTESISVAILSQLRLLDARRLSFKVGHIASSDFELLKQKIKALLP